MPLPSLEQVFIGLYETFRLDDVRNPKRRKPVCRECEIIASASLFTGSAYIMYYSKLGRFTPIPGFTMSIGKWKRMRNGINQFFESAD